jgi:hypothetical protein
VTIPLDRLRDYPRTSPPEGQVTIAFARHQAQHWPSAEVEAYAQHRSQLIHQLVDDTGVTVASWGETDGAHPREVVEIVVAVGPTLIATLGSVLTAWIVHRGKAKPVASPAGPPPPRDTTAALPGASILRADGARLQLTYRDPLTAKESIKLINTFMAGASEKS